MIIQLHITFTSTAEWPIVTAKCSSQVHITQAINYVQKDITFNTKTNEYKLDLG